MAARYLILGAGFTGRRVARLLLDAGERVIVTSRDPTGLRALAAAGAETIRLDVHDPATLAELGRRVPRKARVLHSVPSVRLGDRLTDPTPAIAEALGARPGRVVYLSTTGVYGRATEVDETTPVDPVTERQHVRVQAESNVAAGPWSALVLRPAAIYGPGRGVHQAMRGGRYRIAGDGSHFVSRIHAEDLARIAAAGLRSDLEGAFPVADEEPCRAREISGFCAALLDLPLPPSVDPSDVGETMRTNRRVDGRAVRRALGIELLYPTFRIGIPAAIAEENRTGRGDGAAARDS